MYMYERMHVRGIELFNFSNVSFPLFASLHSLIQRGLVWLTIHPRNAYNVWFLGVVAINTG